MQQNIYYFWDTVAELMVSPLMVAPHNAPVIRHFYDSLANPDNPMAKHAADYELRTNATINDEEIVGHEVEIVTTGKVWLATQTES